MLQNCAVPVAETVTGTGVGILIGAGAVEGEGQVPGGGEGQRESEGREGQGEGRGREVGSVMTSRDAYRLLFLCGAETVKAWAKTVNIEEYRIETDSAGVI
jgi:hypothetical protein